MMSDKVGKCSVPMWCGGLPAGTCDNPAYGVYIEGETWRDPYTGQDRRYDRKFSGYVPNLACVGHGGPNEKGPRVFEDGYTKGGRPMWCAVYEDFVNLQESPASFNNKPWLAIEQLQRDHPRPEPTT